MDNNPNSTTPAARTYLPRDATARMQGRASYKPLIDFAAFAQSLFLSNSSTPELKSNCPTSNCTWKPFDTLGVCNQCQDLGPKLTYGCFDAPYDWDISVTSLMSANITNPNRKQCGYFLSIDGQTRTLMSGFVQSTNGTANGPALGMRFTPLANPFSRLPVGNGSYFFADIKNPLHHNIIATTPGGPSGAFKNVVPSVKECVWYWCVQTIESSYYLGQHRENVTDTYFMNTQNTSWGPVVPSTGTPAMYNANFSLTRPSTIESETETTFSISNTTAVQALQIFDVFSPSFVGTDTPGGESTLRYGNTYNRVPPTQQSMPDDENPWFGDGSIESHSQRLAKALTYIVRNAPVDSNGLRTIKGVSWSTRTFVQIRWEWIALPLTLLLSSLIFLVATVVRSTLEEAQVGIWKTSALAVLFNGIDDDVQNQVDPNCRMGDVRAKAKDLMVNLGPDVESAELKETR